MKHAFSRGWPVALTTIALFCTSAFAALPAMVGGQQVPSLAPLVSETSPAVVNIGTRGTVASPRNPLMDDPFFRRFFGVPRQRERQVRSAGSGVIVDAAGRPRSRVLHPLWAWDGAQLEGWVCTEATRVKREHLEASAYVSINYWSASHDTCVAECHARWAFDDETRTGVWERFKAAPEPVGYDPAIIAGWDGPTSDKFAILRLDPWKLRVFPGSVLLEQKGEVLTWQRDRG